MRLFCVLLSLCLLLENVFAYKILGVLLFPSKSHYYVGHSLLKSLAQDGHDVTVISSFKEKTPIENYHEVFLENSWTEFQKSMMNFAK